MVGTLIGAGLGVLGNIAGGLMASRATRKAKKDLQNQRAENKAWYNRRYNEDATQRADAQRILTLTEDSIRNRNKAAMGAQAVAGGTEESVAATKAANNQALAEAASRIAAQGEARKDNIETQYMNNDRDIRRQLNNLEYNRANQIAGAVRGVSGAGANIADAFTTSNAADVPMVEAEEEEGSSY